MEAKLMRSKYVKEVVGYIVRWIDKDQFILRILDMDLVCHKDYWEEVE